MMSTAFITGIGSGIGMETALVFLQQGYHVLGTLRKESQKQALLAKAAQLPGTLEVITVDLSHTSVMDTVKLALEGSETTSVNVLLNIAGVLHTDELGDISSEQIRQSFLVNAELPIMLTQLLHPYLKNAHWANIINITSMSGYQDSVRFPGLSVYGASKAALGAFTQSVAVELQKDGIHANALAIGAVDTQMLRNAFPDYEAPVSASQMAQYIYGFATEGYRMYNGKVLPVAITNP